MIRGVHVLAISAIALGALSVRATEFYATGYQSLPVLDWVESRPPLLESADVPAAADLARGLSRALPLLTIRDERTRIPTFGPPAVVQRSMGGVRDSARIELDSPGTYAPGEAPIRARLDVTVFNRAVRAAAWSELMGYEMDMKDPDNGYKQVRVAGPDEADAVWLIAPGQNLAGVATLAGHRGAVGFVLQVSYFQPSTDPAEMADSSARAEVTVRQAATDWSAWLSAQLSGSS